MSSLRWGQNGYVPCNLGSHDCQVPGRRCRPAMGKRPHSCTGTRSHPDSVHLSKFTVAVLEPLARPGSRCKSSSSVQWLHMRFCCRRAQMLSARQGKACCQCMALASGMSDLSLSLAHFMMVFSSSSDLRHDMAACFSCHIKLPMSGLHIKVINGCCLLHDLCGSAIYQPLFSFNL